MLQRVTAFTVTELVKETLHGEEGGGKITSPKKSKKIQDILIKDTIHNRVSPFRQNIVLW